MLSIVTSELSKTLIKWVDSDWFNQKVPEDRVAYIISINAIWFATGSMNIAIAMFKLLVEEAHLIGKPSDWIVEEMHFEEQVFLGADRKLVALEMLNKVEKVNDASLDNYNRRIIRTLPTQQ